jgi:exodeoxyribonuclease VII small subunit
MAKKEVTYGEAIAEVEKILASIERSELDVDSMAGAVRRAGELLALCRQKLYDTEQEVERAMASGEPPQQPPKAPTA